MSTASVFTLVDTEGQLMVMKEFKLSQRFKEKTAVKRQLNFYNE